MQFPALWVAEAVSFGVVDEPMNTCTTLAYREGFWTGLQFFDSDGHLWSVVAATPGRALSILDRLLNRSIPVTLTLGTPTVTPVSSVVERLSAVLDADDTDIYDQFMTRAELKAYFHSADTPRALIERARLLGGEREVGDEPA